jgi:hypothetical protein
MPTWSEQELTVAAQRLRLPLSSAAVASRFAQAGGSARLVLEPGLDLEEHLSSQAQGCTAAALMKLVKSSYRDKPLARLTSYSGAGKHVSALVHMVVETNGTDAYTLPACRFEFGSELAKTSVMNKLIEDATEELRILALHFIEGKVAGGLCGVIVEWLLHNQIPDGGIFKLQELGSPDNHWQVAFPQLQVAGFSTAADITSPDLYYKPEKRNQPAVDAVIPPRVCLQMTISANHPINYNGIKAILEQLEQVAFVGSKGACGLRRPLHSITHARHPLFNCSFPSRPPEGAELVPYRAEQSG